MVSASIIGIGTVWPEPVSQELLWEQHFKEHFSDSRMARMVFKQSGVGSRGACVVPMEEDVSGWGTEQRMRRFVEEAVPLAATAIERSLADASVTPADVELLTTVSCTGYATPGIDVLVAKELGMKASIQRVHVGHMGCFAALPALMTVADAAVARGKLGVLVCVELASLHLQAPTDDTEQIVAHALFADAAAALVVAPDRDGLEVIDVVTRTDVGRADLMRWDVTDFGFRMALSPKVPAVLAEHVEDVVRELLHPHGLEVADVAAWALHPGGPRVVDVVAEQLGLSGELDTSRQVLYEHGNASSPTVLLVLQRLVRAEAVGEGEHVVCLAFGPGLTLYAALLRRSISPG